MDHDEETLEVGKISKPTATSKGRQKARALLQIKSSKGGSAPGLLRREEDEATMRDPTDKSATDDCITIKDLGYSPSHRIRMYGERFDIVSDPFTDGNGVAVRVTTAKEPKARKLRLPTSILVGFKDLLPGVKKVT